MIRRLARRSLCLAWVVAVLSAQAAAGSKEAGAPPKGPAALHKIPTPHFEVEFSIAPPIARVYAALCERAYSKFCTIFDVARDEAVWEGKCHVYLFASKDQFLKFAAQVEKSDVGAQSGGYARASKQDPRIVLFTEGKEHVKLQQTLIHEMTHVFLQLYRKETFIPLWVHEGFAQYFEFCHHAGESREKLARRLVKDKVGHGTYTPLRQFFVSTFPPSDLASYSQAWSLIDFIAQTKELRQKTGQFALQLKDQSLEPPTVATVGGKRGSATPRATADGSLNAQELALRAAFGVSLAQFEALWKRYVLANY